MDIISLRRRIGYLAETHSSSLIPEIERAKFSCSRCGWCCRMNYIIRITENISRPSNAIMIFPADIRLIMKITGLNWDEVAQPDIYSCFLDGDKHLVIGWILKRSGDESCLFYMEGKCTIYDCRPMICRCYPFFWGNEGLEIMQCNGLGKNTENKNIAGIGRELKRYEIKKLWNYIRIIRQIEKKLDIANMKSLPAGYSGEVLVYDGENVSLKNI